MYITAAFVFVLYALLLFLSGKEEISAEVSGMFKPFYRGAQYLYKLFCIRKIPLLSETQVEADLKKVFPTQGKEQKKAEYYIKKIALTLFMILVGTFLALIARIQSKSGLIVDDNGAIARRSFADGEQIVDIAALANGKKQVFQVRIAPRELSGTEAEAYYKDFVKELPCLILGDNPSLQEVASDLLLLEEYVGFPFAVEWISGRPDVISGGGTLYSCEEKTEILLTARIVYADREWEEEIMIYAVPAVLTSDEQEHEALKTFLYASEQEARTEETWKLPGMWQGNVLKWKQVKEDYSFLLWITFIIAAVAVYLMSDRDLHERAEAQKRLMKREYPDIVHKMVLYLGAGLTVRGAFQKIALEYEQECARNGGKVKKKLPAYEEMLYTCRELQAGVSEGAAYGNFGKRTGLREYVRLGTLLTQNLKKGNSTLLTRLREEAARAYEEQLQSSRKLTEEAVTKLLFPMVMLLAVIMIIVMIPAFWSMGA